MEALTNKKIDVETRKSRVESQAGFTLIESLIAMMIVTIGLIGTAAAVSIALKITRISRHVTDAKAVALAQLEQIHSLRDSNRLNFKQINNVANVDNVGASVNFSGFEPGVYRVSNTPGADGIFGTADDPPAGDGIDKICGTIDDSPAGYGPDAICGTADDLNKVGFTRTTVISNPLTNLKMIVVTVQYSAGDGSILELSATGYLNNDLKQN